jgi:cell wall-associated NlpC family hydrolase
VFFNTMRRAFSHVGIYVGRQIHPRSRTGASVRVESMESKYWATRFNGARRVETQDSNAVAALAPQS